MCYNINQKMGECISSTKGRQHDPGPRFDQVPTDTAAMDAGQYPLLSFKTLLTKIKLKRCAIYRQLGVRFEFAGFEEFELKTKLLINETARWEISHLLEFKATLYEIRQKFVTIAITDDQNKTIGSLKINLYLLATGPYHQDFAIALPKAQGARLSFNLKIAQMVKMRLRLNEVEMIPKNKQFPGDMFAFALRSIIGDKIEENGMSYKYQVAFDIKNLITSGPNESVNNVMASMLKKTASIKPMPQPKITWSSTSSKEMPQIQAQIPLYDLHGASFNIIFYFFNHDQHEVYSQCFLSYNKLANYPQKEAKDSLGNITWQVREIQLDLKTWDHGKEAGKAIFSLVFEIQTHIKQMQVCVRTEKGILESSPVYGGSGGGGIPEELLELQKLGNEIQNLFIEATKPNRKRTSSAQRENWVGEINNRLKKQKEILMSSAKESRMMFVYQDEKSLLKGQRGLIELGFRTRSILNQDNELIAPNCWELLVPLMKRGELTLAYMGYKQNQIEDCLSGKESQFLKRKKEVSMSYHALLIDLLHTTLQSLEAYTYESQREFAELFCAYAYFRIPKFRNEVLAAISRANDPEIEEWRGTEFSLSEAVNQVVAKDMQVDGKTAFSLMFDWENHFYKVIEKEELFTKTEGKLTEMFRYNGWEERMRKRGGAFFAFIRFWVSYVENIAVNSKHVSWRFFPGYNKILHSFLVEMKSRNVQDYSESMRKAAASLLSNEKLLNPFVLILFKKTNSNDQIAVIKAFDLIHLFFGSIQSRGRTLPTTFDLKFLLKGIKNILQGEAAFSIGKVLLLIYDHYRLFPVDFRIEVSLYLMSKVFFKLFLHWSGNVRTIFHHLLFIRIYHESSKPIYQMDLKDQEIYKSNPEYRTEIISRYRKLLLILENAQEFQHKITRNRIDVYEKEAYKKLRNKVNKKRRITSNSLIPENRPSQAFSSQEEYERQLTTELSFPKLEKYSSEVLTKNLKVAVEHTKTAKKEEVIIHTKSKNQLEITTARKRKLSFFQTTFQDELVPLKQAQIIYTKLALEQYQKISEGFIQHVQKNKQSVPIVKLQLSLDEKQLRPEGLTEHEQW